MNDEQQWLERADAADETGAAERYLYFMRPEPREGLGPIQRINDPYLGPDALVRTMKVGMTRNAAPEHKKEVLVYLKPFPHIRIEAAKPLQGWYQDKFNIDADGDAHRPRPCFTEAVLTEPYGGYCAVGCAFCYINSGMRGYRGTGLISVPMGYGDQIAEQLKKMRRSAAAYFSSFTDPFTPLEAHYHNTQRAAEAFAAVGLPMFFLSRLRYPEWAVDLLQANPHSYAQKSINTPDPDDWRLLSPGALPLAEHLDDIRRLKAAGVYVSIQCNPIVPGVTSNEQVLRLFSLLREAGADHVIVKFVEAGYSWAPAMVERMTKRFGERGEAFAALFTQNIGGQKSVDEAYRMKAHRLYSTHARRIGLTYATCYEYRYARDEAGNVIDKTGVSVGREFTTASQCHGHAVPMYTRNSAQEQFRPVDECPPSGCLYCADENDGKPRCGDELAGEAWAVRSADMKHPIGSGPSRRTSHQTTQTVQLGVIRR